MSNAPSTTGIEELVEEVRGRATVVVDTSTLVADPASLTAFPDADLVIPMTVIEELDGLKTRQDQVGANARAVVRALEAHRNASTTRTLTEPVELGENATVRVEPNGLRLEELAKFHLPADKPDHRILAAALGLAHDGRDVHLVSSDAAMRLKADTLGLRAVDYEVNTAPFTTRDKPGWVEVEVSKALIDDLYAHRQVRLDELADWDTDALGEMVVNEFAVLRNTDAGKQSALVRHTGDHLTLLRSSASSKAWGVTGRNKEQQFALTLLNDPDVEVVALSGRAGTGKSMLAIASALEQTFERDEDGENRYDRVIVLRPMYAIGKQEVGFLPGELQDKVAPWFDAVVDSMVAMSPELDHKTARDRMEM